MANKNISNEAVNTLVRCITQLADTDFQELKHDKTFPSTVISKVSTNTDTRYLIKDQSGTERKIKCALPGIDLKPNTKVWVKIPSSRITDMHICGIR